MVEIELCVVEGVPNSKGSKLRFVEMREWKALLHVTWTSRVHTYLGMHNTYPWTSPFSQPNGRRVHWGDSIASRLEAITTNELSSFPDIPQSFAL
jgi:hypothetical protein